LPDSGTAEEAVSPDLAGFISLTGEAESIGETFSRFGVAEITHDYTLYLIDPMNRMHALFTRSQDAATIAADLITLIHHQR